MSRGSKATTFEVLELRMTPDGRKGLAWVTVPGLRRPVQFTWPGPAGFEGGIICKYPNWDSLTEDQRQELGDQITISVVTDRRYLAVAAAVAHEPANRP